MWRYAKLDATGSVVDFILSSGRPSDEGGFTYVLDEGQFAEPLPLPPPEPEPRALVDANGVVVNIVKAAAGSQVPDGLLMVPRTDSSVSIGWKYFDGVFTPPPPDLVAVAASIRKARNDKLVASDWTQVADAPVDKSSWANYRQALRDITKQQDFPLSVVWPTEPS